MKWNPTQRKLIRQSIAHWRRLSTGNRMIYESMGPNDCALCETYLAGQCTNCPIKIKTKVTHCGGTPYKKAHDMAKKDGLDSAQFREAAKAELEFLEKLLQEGL